jgi:hypothetical protein
MEPLISTSQVEKMKHLLYDYECSRHKWKLVPFVYESYGALGIEGSKLLGAISSHHPSMSQSEFLLYANQVLSSNNV